jgi:purine-cytosine permease-like protein
MRLKLVLIASLLAAIVGAGTSVAIVFAVFSSMRPLAKPGWLVLGTFLLPLATCLLASIFVYRHTARRRKLQAFLTALLSLLLSLAGFIVASIVTARLQPPPAPPLEQRPVA